MSEMRAGYLTSIISRAIRDAICAAGDQQSAARALPYRSQTVCLVAESYFLPVACFENRYIAALSVFSEHLYRNALHPVCPSVRCLARGACLLNIRRFIMDI